ncbi:MAG: SGNH/GDSL hydrolase family protein [Verrucomicrobia bacterium]|nr:SGNH/GDSL hydrolase family protein [Verrucomicrobiota bacterium]
MKTIFRSTIALLILQGTLASFAQTLESKPTDSYFEKFKPLKAPTAGALLLKPGDRLAICGDSITEQKMYSRIMETYLTVCTPELGVTVRQYGWGGEVAPGFLARMTNDCLRFQPTIATTCYGMNDHGYRPYEEAIGQRYRNASTAIIRAFKGAGARVVHGSPGCVGKKPGWSKDNNWTSEDLNLNLCELRNIGIEIAQAEQVGFADVFWPMLTAGFAAQQKHGTNYAIAGKDGVHPDWAGQTVMAQAFLHALGLEGDIGTFTVDLRINAANVSAGHGLVGYEKGELTVLSKRYPFCAPVGDVTKHNNIRSAMALIPFNDELNRLMLVVRNPKAQNYKITWGAESHSYSAEQLGKGVNLAADFVNNPFTDAFNKVDAAVAAKQAYETKQIKELFHGDEGKRDMAATVAASEQTRAPLAEAIKIAFVPVRHTIKIEAE